MENFKAIINKNRILQIFHKIITIIRTFFIVWLPLFFKKPKMIKFFFQWLISFRPKAAPFKDGVAWIPYEVLDWMDSYLAKDMKVFEWGSGGSTFFFAKRVKELVSVEHNPKWHSLFSDLLKKNNVFNCRYLLKEPEVSEDFVDPSDFQGYRSSSKNYKGFNFKNYCTAIDSYPNKNFDIVFIDGRARASCIPRAINKIKPGGFLVLDDSDRKTYLEATSLLKDWERREFYGPKPYIPWRYYATVWQKKNS